MAQKNPTYLRFAGDAERYFRYQGGVGSSSATSLVVTTFVRLLRWPTMTTPIWFSTTGDDTEEGHYGLFLYVDEPAKGTSEGRMAAGEELCAGLWVGSNAGPIAETLVPLQTGSVPVKLGNILQIEYVGTYDSTDGNMKYALIVDGTIVWTGNLDGTAFGDELDQVMWVGHRDPGSVGFDFGTTISGTSEWLVGDEFAEYDIIQVMVEFGRTVTVSGSPRAITAIANGTVLDPFEELALDASASSGWVSLLDEGSGTPSGTSHSGNLSWADASKVDPQISTNQGVWTFENCKGYGSQGDDLDVNPFPRFAPVGSRPDPTAGELRLRDLPCVWQEMGECRDDPNNWYEWEDWNHATRRQTGQKAVGLWSMGNAGSGSVNGGSADVENFGGVSGGNQGNWSKFWFYDPGSGGGSSFQLRAGMYAGGVEDIMGVRISVSSTNYVTRTDQGGEVASSVARSAGWHEFAIYHEEDFLGTNDTVRFYIDGTQVREETGAAGAVYRTGFRSRKESGDPDCYIDWWRANFHSGGNTPDEFKGLVAPSGTIVLPQLQPPGDVTSFDSVVFDEATAGSNSMEVGSITKEFRHDDGGGFGSFQTLNDSNLQALTPGGLGADVIEVRLTFASGMDDMSSAAMRQVTINWTERAPYYVGGSAARQRLTRGVGWVV